MEQWRGWFDRKGGFVKFELRRACGASHARRRAAVGNSTSSCMLHGVFVERKSH